MFDPTFNKKDAYELARRIRNYWEQRGYLPLVVPEQVEAEMGIDNKGKEYIKTPSYWTIKSSIDLKQWRI